MPFPPQQPPTPQGLSHPRIPVQSTVTTEVSIPAASLILNLGNKSSTSLSSTDSLTDCKEN